MIEYIDHIIIYITDMEKAINFYTEILGLPLRMKSPHWSEVGGEHNGMYIGLHLSDNVERTTKETTDIGFRVRDIEQARKELENKGIEFYDKITKITPTSSFTSFMDPDGNRLSIYATK